MDIDHNENIQEKIPTGELKEIQFRILSPEEICNISVCLIDQVDAIESGSVKLGGLSDPRMGPVNKFDKCSTCRKNIEGCAGHFGHIEFAIPLFHPGFMENVMQVFRCVCFHCSIVLLDRKDPRYKKICSIPNPQNRLIALSKICKNKTSCDFPYKSKGQIKNFGCGKPKPIIRYIGDFIFSAEFPYDFKDYGESKITLNAQDVYRVLSKIDPVDYFILGSSETKPQWKITTCMLVPPPPLRPSNTSNIAAIGEDDLTHRLTEIIKFNNGVKDRLENGDPKKELPACIQILQLYYGLYIDNSSASQQPNQRGGKILKGIKQRLEKKEGRIRGNLMGKRTDFTARTPITPDPNLSIDEMGMPFQIAKNLTFPEKVSYHNLDELTKAVKNGPSEIFGANYVTMSNGDKKDLRFDTKRDEIILKPGMVVDRHLKDGDIVILNRQPTLHIFGMMGHKLKLMPHCTFRLNLSPTTPYNADFDGDEMNITVPQTYEAKAEVEELMGVSRCMLTPQSNKPTMGMVQDALLLSRILTNRDSFLEREEVMQLLCFVSVPIYRLPTPCILKPKPLWSGKQIFSHIMPKLNYFSNSTGHPTFEDMKEGEVLNTLRKNFYTYCKAEIKDINEDIRIYCKDELMLKKFLKNSNRFFGRNVTLDDIDKFKTLKNIHKYCFDFHSDLSPTDTKVVIQDGELISGYLCKKSIGNAHNSLIQIICKDFGYERNHQFMDDLKKIALEYSKYKVVSVGIKDMRVDPATKGKIQNIVNKASKKMEEIKRSGVTMKEYEQLSNKMLNAARSKACKDTLRELKQDNAFWLMITAASKGSAINPSQMVRCLAQQDVEGKRIPNGFYNRTMPHFKQGDTSPAAKGFISSNYMTGLNPQETFFHAMAGREGISDTAVKTSDIGYLQRRLCKAMEDIGIQYDGTVRNSLGEVVQFCFGEDGMDARFLEFSDLENYKISQERFHSLYVWDLEAFEQFEDKNKWMLKELNRLTKDLELVNSRSSSRIVVPIPFKRLLQNLPFKTNKIQNDNDSLLLNDPIRIIKDVHELQKRLWKLLPKGAERWENLTALQIRSVLASKRVIQEYKLCEKNWKYILEKAENYFKKTLASPGDMVGTIAGQSIGEPATQMTLNSVDWNEKILYRIQDWYEVQEMGKLIDNLMEENDDEIEVQPDGALYLPIDRLDISIPSLDENGKMIWKPVTAVTKHLPINEDGSNTLLKVTTRSGRTVTATKAKSFLTRVNNKIIATKGSDLKIGDRIPVVRNLPTDETQIIPKTLDVSSYLSKKEFTFGSDLLKCDEIHKLYKEQGKRNWWEENVDKTFVIPQKSGQTALGSIHGTPRSGPNRHIYKKGIVYPKKCKNVTAEIPEQIELDREFGFFMGAYLAEGMANNTQVIISNKDEDFQNKIYAFCKRWNIGYHIQKTVHPDHSNWTGTDIRLHSTVFARLLREMCNTGSDKKVIPGWMITGPEEFVIGVLDGYFSGDGCVCKKSGTVNATSVSENLIDGMLLMLARFNIYGAKYASPALTKNNVNSPVMLPYWNIAIRNENAQRFSKLIDFTVKYKKERLEGFESRNYKRSNGKFDIIPGIQTGILKGEHHRDDVEAILSTLPKNHPDYNNLHIAVNNDVYFDEIIKIEEIEPSHEHVYDLTVKDTKTFMVYSGIASFDTFHHAGIAEKNVTLGVPRLKEIVNAAKKTKTPSLTIRLKKEICKNQEAAEELMRRIECLMFRDIVKGDFQVIYEPELNETLIEEDKEIVRLFNIVPTGPFEEDTQLSPYVLRFEMKAEKLVQMKITMEQVVDTILAEYGELIRVQWSDEFSENCILRIRPISEKYASALEEESLLKELGSLMIRQIKISGISRIEKTFLQEENGEFVIETEGVNLAEVVGVPGVDGLRTITNDFNEAFSFLGIEAARATILREINYILSFDNGYVNHRHPALLADVMNHLGYIMSVTRHGVNRRETGPLSKCSFEETGEVLFEAGIYNQVDKLSGVTEAIMLGRPPPIGTNKFSVHLNTEMLQNPKFIPEDHDKTKRKIETESFIFKREFDDPNFESNLNFIPSSPSRSLTTSTIGYRPSSPSLTCS